MKGEAETLQMEEAAHRVHIYSIPIFPFARVSKSDRQISLRLMGEQVNRLF